MKAVHVDEIETLPVLGRTLAWKPVRRALGISAFGINAYHGVKQGDLVVEEHEDAQQELYLVLRGRARFRSGEVEVDAPAGTFVLCEPDEHRVAHATVPDTVVVAVGGEAQRFQPSAWEFSFRAKGLTDVGHAAEGREVAEEGLALYPDRVDILYALACIEEAEGNRVRAVETLRTAITRHPAVREWAEGEERLRPVLREL